MRTGRPKTTLTMSSDERTHLLAITRSRSLPALLTFGRTFRNDDYALVLDPNTHPKFPHRS